VNAVSTGIFQFRHRRTDCRRQVEPDPAEMAQRYGAATTVLDWSARLVCSRCGSRQVDMVVTGARTP
jgi:hypothetical protein